MRTMCVGSPLFLVASTVPAQAQVRLVQEPGPGDQPAYQVQNAFYRLRLVPGRGGRVDEFAYLPAGGAWAITKQAQQGLLMDHIEYGWPGELLDAVYQPEVLESTPQRVRIRMTYTSQKTHPGLRVQKTVTFEGGSRAITVQVTLANTAKAACVALFWPQHIFQPGPKEHMTRYYRPSAHGLDIAWAKPGRTGVAKGGSDYVRDPLAGWTATIDPEVGVGAVFVMDYNYLDGRNSHSAMRFS